MARENLQDANREPDREPNIDVLNVNEDRWHAHETVSVNNRESENFRQGLNT